MNMLIHAQTLKGRVRDLRMSEPVIHADNEAKGRSGHLGHAMADLGGGRVIAFSANTSAIRPEALFPSNRYAFFSPAAFSFQPRSRRIVTIRSKPMEKPQAGTSFPVKLPTILSYLPPPPQLIPS